MTHVTSVSTVHWHDADHLFIRLRSIKNRILFQQFHRLMISNYCYLPFVSCPGGFVFISVVRSLLSDSFQLTINI